MAAADDANGPSGAAQLRKVRDLQLNADHSDLFFEEWKDFEYSPIEESSVLNVRVSEEFRHVFGLLYAVMASGENSERTLKLTSRAIKLNAGNPTAWMLRRRAARALAKSDPEPVWSKELAFTATVISKNRKNYQAWEHRRFAAESANMVRAELEFTDVVLSNDEKNYHAWSHRQWIVREHGITHGELDATEWFIRTDIRNNSAWNHRWLVTGVVKRRDEEELDFALDIVSEAPRNESVWNYIHALGRNGVCMEAVKRKALDCLKVDAGCVPARRFLVLNGSLAEAGAVSQHCELLASGVDPVRKKYWQTQMEAARAVIDGRGEDRGTEERGA